MSYHLKDFHFHPSKSTQNMASVTFFNLYSSVSCPPRRARWGWQRWGDAATVVGEQLKLRWHPYLSDHRTAGSRSRMGGGGDPGRAREEGARAGMGQVSLQEEKENNGSGEQDCWHGIHYYGYRSFWDGPRPSRRRGQTQEENKATFQSLSTQRLGHRLLLKRRVV